MAKVKDMTKSAGRISAAEKKNPVKDGRVTKSAAAPAALGKKTAKMAAAKLSVKDLKSKRPPTPESDSGNTSASEADSDDESVSDASSSSGSSESEGENTLEGARTVKVNGVPKPNGVKLNGKAAALRADGSETSDSEGTDASEGSEGFDSSESESDEEPAAPKSKAAQGAKAPATFGGVDESDESESSESSEEELSKTGSKVAKPTSAAVNGADDSDEGSDASSSGSADSEEENDEEIEAETAPRKRKADIVEESTAKKSKTAENNNAGAVANLFVGNLSWNVDEEWLQREFEEFGELARCNIITDRNTGRSKGFGYVEFVSAADATKAHEAKKGALLDGRELNVDFAAPRADKPAFDRGDRVNSRAGKFGDQQNEPSSTLFIGNVSFHTNSDEIGEYFGEYGTVTRVSLPTDMETGTLKGFGYIDFTSQEEATAALEGLNGTPIGGRNIRLDYATPRTGGGDRGGFRGGRGGDRGGFRGGRGGFGDRGRGGFGDRGRGGFNDRGRGGRGGRGAFSTNRGGVGDFSGKKMTF